MYVDWIGLDIGLAVARCAGSVGWETRDRVVPYYYSYHHHIISWGDMNSTCYRLARLDWANNNSANQKRACVYNNSTTVLPPIFAISGRGQ